MRLSETERSTTWGDLKGSPDTGHPPESEVRLRKQGTDSEILVQQLMAENRALRQRIDQLSRYRHLAYRDALTGLYNRRHFDERLAQECSRARRYRVPVSLLLVDLDHLKTINDTAGHSTGDAVLGWIGSFLAMSCRDIDIVCRIGGDEFAIVLPSTDRSGAESMLTRLLDKLAMAESKPTLPAGLEIRFSAGIAGTPADFPSPATLLAQADVAMYAKKRARKGESSVVIAA